MKITREDKSETEVILNVISDQEEITIARDKVLLKLSKSIKVSGFRQGKVPVSVAEKHLDKSVVDNEIIDELVNTFYFKAIEKEKLRPVSKPSIELKKYVPGSILEIDIKFDVIGNIKLPDYKKLAVKKTTSKVSAAEINEVLERLKAQLAEYKLVKRKAKSGDRVWINFEGFDEKNNPIDGAKGDDYPLLLGSNTFIPGFEENLVGLKESDEKVFELEFPSDYGVKALQSKKVKFNVKINKVEEANEQKINDNFAKKIGPFASLEDLKKDIKKQLTIEKDNEAQRLFEDELVKNLAKKSKISIPESLINEEITNIEKEFKQNLVYRGETFKDYLLNNNLSEEEFINKELYPSAIERLTAGLALSSIAEKEQITVSPKDVEDRIELMKKQYASDSSMLSSLESDDGKRNIVSRMLTEKTIKKLSELNTT